jgi:hypothetical protein
MNAAAPVGLVGLGLVGAATASLLLGLDAYAGPVLALAPPLWALALTTTRRALVRPSTRALARAGGALGVGFGVFWLSPEALPLPLFDAWQARYLELDLARPLFDVGAFLLPLVTTLIGAGLGLAWARRSRARRLLAVALACALMLGVVPALPDVPTQAPAGLQSVLYGRFVRHGNVQSSPMMIGFGQP